jgi:aromatic ring hydroxylase
MISQQIAQDPFQLARTFGFEVHDPQRFAQNMARLVEETNKAVTAFAGAAIRPKLPRRHRIVRPRRIGVRNNDDAGRKRRLR